MIGEKSTCDQIYVKFLLFSYRSIIVLSSRLALTIHQLSIILDFKEKSSNRFQLMNTFFPCLSLIVWKTSHRRIAHSCKNEYRAAKYVYKRTEMNEMIPTKDNDYTLEKSLSSGPNSFANEMACSELLYRGNTHTEKERLRERLNEKMCAKINLRIHIMIIDHAFMTEHISVSPCGINK